jgi:hypothetical protein
VSAGLLDRAVEERLARRADDERPAQIGELAEPAEHLEAVRRVLGKAEPGIDEHLLARDAGAGGKREALAQLVEHFVHHVVVVRLLVHVARAAARVHQDDRRGAARHHAGQLGVVAQAR